MKKRVLFCIENYQHGGITKALENIISLIDMEIYDVGIFVVNQENGPYKKIFSQYIKYPSDSLLNAFCTNYRKHSGLKRLALFAIKSTRKIIAKSGFDIFHHRLKNWARRISADKYDCVIAFAEGYITDFVSKIEGHKVAWIHIDYKRYLSYVNNIDETQIYDKFDAIIIPSKFSSLSFLDIFPQFTDRVKVIPNVIDTCSIKTKANKSYNIDPRFNNDSCRIISVGRICYEKRFFEIPSIAKKLKLKGLNFKWYIIGDGSEIETGILTDSINQHSVNDCVITLGRKDNPYPYIAQSDILVSTSLSETFSYVVFEAKTLGTPIVCADFGTAPEILRLDEGIITPIQNMDTAIFEILSENKNKLTAFNKNLQKYAYDNNIIMNKIYTIFNN